MPGEANPGMTGLTDLVSSKGQRSPRELVPMVSRPEQPSPGMGRKRERKDFSREDRERRT